MSNLYDCVNISATNTLKQIYLFHSYKKVLLYLMLGILKIFARTVGIRLQKSVYLTNFLSFNQRTFFSFEKLVNSTFYSYNYWQENSKNKKIMIILANYAPSIKAKHLITYYNKLDIFISLDRHQTKNRSIILLIFLVFSLILTSCGGTEKKGSKNQNNNGQKGGNDKPIITEAKITNELLVNGLKTEIVNFAQVSPKEIEAFKPKKSQLTITYAKYGNLTGEVFKEVSASYTDENDDGIIKTGDKYFYNHIDGDKFTSFLPSANSMAILSLDPNKNSLIRLRDIGDSQLANDQIKTRLNDTQVKYDKFLSDAKDYVFKGYAFARFANDKFRYNYEQSGGTPANTEDYAIEDKFYRGKFELKIIDFRTTDSKQDRQYYTLYNNYSLNITFDETIIANEGPKDRQANGVWKTAHKKLNISHTDITKFTAEKLNAHVTVEHEDFGGSLFMANGDSGGFMRIETAESYFGYSYKNNKPDQVAGAFRFFKDYNVSLSSNKHSSILSNNFMRIYLDVVFSSTKACAPTDTDC